MVAVPPLAWLDYAGQTLQELLACKDTHRLDSILCAVEEGLQAESKERALTEEEQFVLAVMALDREVNNGGYRQFFSNSSRRFVPIIVDSLRRIECEEAAAITCKALTGPVAVLDECDHEFYQLGQIGPKVFRCVEVHQGRIQLSKRSVPLRPARVSANISKLYVHLQFARPRI